MADLLTSYDLPDARRRLLRASPEIKRALDLLAALLAAQGATQLDGAGLLRADAVAGAIRTALGQMLDDGDGQSIGQRLALLRLHRAARDADLVFSWPYNLVGSGVTIAFTLASRDALARIVEWDAVLADRDPATRAPIYPGNLLADLDTLVGGVRIKEGAAL